MLLEVDEDELLMLRKALALHGDQLQADPTPRIGELAANRALAHKLKIGGFAGQPRRVIRVVADERRGFTVDADDGKRLSNYPTLTDAVGAHLYEYGCSRPELAVMLSERAQERVSDHDSLREGEAPQYETYSTKDVCELGLGPKILAKR